MSFRLYCSPPRRHCSLGHGSQDASFTQVDSVSLFSTTAASIHQCKLDCTCPACHGGHVALILLAPACSSLLGARLGIVSVTRCHLQCSARSRRSSSGLHCCIITAFSRFSPLCWWSARLTMGRTFFHTHTHTSRLMSRPSKRLRSTPVCTAIRVKRQNLLGHSSVAHSMECQHLFEDAR